MSETEASILELLKDGWTYAQIQEELQVSSKTIAAVRKAYFPNAKSADITLSDNSSHTKSQPIIHEGYSPPVENNPISNKLKTTKTMNRDFESDGRSSKDEIEKYRIQLEHKLELEKLHVSLREKEREFNLRARELEFKREELENMKRKIAQDKRALLLRIEEIVNSCEDREYDQSELELMLNDTNNLIAACKTFCSDRSIVFQGTSSKALLEKIVSELNEAIDLFDEEDDDVIEIEFDSSFRKMAERKKYDPF